MQQAPVLDPAPSAPALPRSEPDEPALPDDPPVPSALRHAAVAAVPALCLDGAFATLLARADAPPWAFGLLVGLTGLAVYAVARPRAVGAQGAAGASRRRRRRRA